MDEHEKIDESLYNERTLYLLNIKELRDLGRKFGVPSPTTKTKQELVDYILNVVYGKVQVPVKNLYGRPSSREFNMDKYLDKIKKNSEISNTLKKISLGEDFGLLKVSSPSVGYKVFDNIETRIYYKSNEEHFLRNKAFIDSPDDIKISKEIAEKFKLENLDVVEIKISENLIKIISINGIKIKDKFDEIIVNGTAIRAGQNKDFYLSTKEEVKKEIANLIEICNKNDINLIIFTPNEYNGEKISCVNYNEKEDKSQIYKKLMLLAGICEKAVYSGEDLIVVIEDGNWVDKVTREFDQDVFIRIKKYFQETFSKITDLGNIYITFKIEVNFVY